MDIDLNNIVGSIYKSISCGDMTITKYVNYKEVHIRFINTGYETKRCMGDIKLGKVKDAKSPSVCGVGIVGGVTSINGEQTKEYKLWHSVLTRCYSDKFHKKQSTYKECCVSENFKHYQYFKNWCSSQVGFNEVGFCMDKDILIKGNKTYSESTCVFVPKEINQLFVKHSGRRGKYMIGVCFNKRNGKFKSIVSIGGRLRNIGDFKTELEAFQAYKCAKESYIKELAEKWKLKIDRRVCDALINYQVETID